jgi:hypothetical protein
MQTDPSDIVRAIDIIKAGNYAEDLYVKGLRRGRPLTDSFFTGGMSIFESIYLQTSLWDINAQPNIFHRKFFETWQSPPHDFALDLYAYYLAQKTGMRLSRFDVEFPERVHGHSNWNTGFKSKLRFIKRTIDFSVKLKGTLKRG